VSLVSNATMTMEETNSTGANTMTSSSSRGIEFYFYLAIVVMGVIGTAANGLILYALVASKQHKKHFLIVNQNALDLYSCIFLIITYSVKLGNIHLTGLLGFWLCKLLLNDNLLWWGTLGSMINLAIISIERYLKIVHVAWSNTKLRQWMIYTAAAFAWIISIVYIVTLSVPTSTVLNGICLNMIYFSAYSKLVSFIGIFIYITIVLIDIFCYGRILLVVRRQAKIMAGHDAPGGSNASQNPLNQMQTNVTKTMVLVCGYYAVMWLPLQISHLIMMYSTNPNKYLISGYYQSLLIAYLYMCTNPFIYATKFDPIREVLLRMIPFKKTNVASTTGISGVPRGGAAGADRIVRHH